MVPDPLHRIDAMVWRLAMPPDAGGFGFSFSQIRDMTLAQFMLLTIPKEYVERMEEGSDWDTLRLRNDMRLARQWTSYVKLME